MSANKLIELIHKCSPLNGGDGYYIKVNGETMRLRSHYDVIGILENNKGKTFRYRCSGFSSGTHWKMAAVVS